MYIVAFYAILNFLCVVIANTDIKYRLSGGAANSTPSACLGGAKSTTELVDNSLDNLFPDAPGSETTSGSSAYLCIYVHNGHATLTMLSTKIYVTQDTNSTDDEIDVAKGTSAINATEQTIANINTAPSGTSFTHPANYAAGISLGDIPPGQSQAVWFKRTINVGANAYDNNSYKFEVGCDSAA